MAPMTRSLIRVALLGALSSFVAHSALAQMDPNMAPGNTPSAKGARANATPRVAPQAAALPGSKSEKFPAAPAERAATEMGPNEALFDSINRGDLKAARDAIGRGAELDSQNILGMTPMELSVDLGRNDISFLLLSLRGADSAKTARTADKGSAKAAAAKPTAPAKPASQPAAQIAKAPMPAAPTPPRQFASDGGAPIPNAGFLGFNAR
jgi:hypothetical protein